MRKFLTLTAAAAFAVAFDFSFGAPASAQNLVAYWNFDVNGADPTLDTAPAGGVADDGILGSTSGTPETDDPAYDCTPANIAPTPGNVCSLDFTGSDSDFVQAADSADLKPSPNITVAAWVFVRTVPGASFQSIVSKEDNTSKGYGLVVDNTGKLRFQINFQSPPGACKSPGLLSANTWVHVAGTYDGATIKCYEDGVLTDSPAFATGLTNSTNPLIIGASSAVAGGFLDGLIDDVRIYNRVLTLAEIEQLATTFTITKELVSADEEDGTTNNNSLIDLNEEWAFVLKVTLTNNGPGTLDVTVIDPLPGDNELGDGTSRLKRNYNVKDPDDAIVCPNDKLTPTAGSAEAFGTGNSAKCHVTWTIDDFAPSTEMLTMNTSTDVNPAGLKKNDPVTKQEYTSGGTYCLNQGATLKGTIVEVPFEQESNGVEVDNINPGGGFELQEDDNCNEVIESGTLVNVINVFVP